MDEKIKIKINSLQVQELLQKDKRLSKLITLVGDLELELRRNPFESLVKSIIGQQLSVKAAATIFNRFLEMCSELTPTAILSTDPSDLRSVGLSHAKIVYIRDLSEKVNEKRIQLAGLNELDNEQVIDILMSVKGIGKWTAEMFLIFSLGRMDVLSLGDVGVQRAVKWLYKMDKSENGKGCLEMKSSLWKPHYTIASLYLWESVNLGFVDTFESVEEVYESIHPKNH